jgi:hypothetical protein
VVRRALLYDIKQEVAKLRRNRIRADVYVVITNVPLTGVRHVGTRDRIDHLTAQCARMGMELQVWGAADLDRMLDAYPDVRTTFVDVLPGDVLAALRDRVMV